MTRFLIEKPPKLAEDAINIQTINVVEEQKHLEFLY